MPISGAISSNWHPWSRALNVAYYLIQRHGLDQERVSVVGYSSTFDCTTTRPKTGQEPGWTSSLSRQAGYETILIRQNPDRDSWERYERSMQFGESTYR
jgi:hypothetical protein